MKLEKAIEILTDLDKRGDFAPGGDVQPAVKLGNEALKFRRHVKLWYPTLFPEPLPGETED